MALNLQCQGANGSHFPAHLPVDNVRTTDASKDLQQRTQAERNRRLSDPRCRLLYIRQRWKATQIQGSHRGVDGP